MYYFVVTAIGALMLIAIGRKDVPYTRAVALMLASVVPVSMLVALAPARLFLPAAYGIAVLPMAFGLLVIARARGEFARLGRRRVRS